MCLNDNGRWYGDVYHNAIVAASEDEELYLQHGFLQNSSVNDNTFVVTKSLISSR